MIVGAGYASREYCDGQTLASTGRWPILKGGILSLHFGRRSRDCLWVTLTVGGHRSC